MKYSINLFPEPEMDTVDKIVHFAFHYLRYILVITQFVVICVFFFRFKVDQDIVDLKESLSQKKEIVEATESMLDEVSYLDGKTQDLAEILRRQDQYFAMFRYFRETIPDDMQISRISYSDTTVEFAGAAVNPAVIQDYESRMNQEGRFNEVILGNLERTDNGFSFSVQLKEYLTQPVTETTNESE